MFELFESYKQMFNKPSDQHFIITEDDEENEIAMRFSNELATEFSNTINEFTSICAKMVEVKHINKNAANKFYDLYAKIKNLADAAEKTD